ncbi:MAG: NAD-dependent epimerase/dehydratase family protein [Ignavibacteriaceae bacterium]
MKHIILGAGGAISRVLVKELLFNDQKIKLAARNFKVIEGVESIKADLLNFNEVNNLIEEFSTAYLIAGLTYSAKVWNDQWPKIMRNVVEACSAKNAKLIFFDNVYAYGKVNGVMTEDTPINPSSKKGEVRAKLLEYLNEEIKKKNITALIARAADFYGPYTEGVSLISISVLDKLQKGKKAQWFCNAKVKHSFTNTGDCGKALYLLAKSESNFNQTWHMPTANPAKTGEELIQIAAEKLNVKPGYTVLKKWMFKMIGTFNPLIKELTEMLYQYEDDYIFDSSKFEKKFDFKPTSYEQGIEESIKSMKGA